MTNHEFSPLLLFHFHYIIIIITIFKEFMTLSTLPLLILPFHHTGEIIPFREYSVTHKQKILPSRHESTHMKETETKSLTCIKIHEKIHVVRSLSSLEISFSG